MYLLLYLLLNKVLPIFRFCNYHSLDENIISRVSDFSIWQKLGNINTLANIKAMNLKWFGKLTMKLKFYYIAYSGNKQLFNWASINIKNCRNNILQTLEKSE